MSLTFLVGCPRSGKSTFANKWVNEKPGRVVVCADTFRKTVYDKVWWQYGESMAYCHAYVAVRALLLDGYEVLYDDTNTSDESLKRIFEIDPSAKPHLIMTPPEICKNRAVELNQEYLLPVIDRCWANLYNRIKKMQNFVMNEEFYLTPETAGEAHDFYCYAFASQYTKKEAV